MKSRLKKLEESGELDKLKFGNYLRDSTYLCIPLTFIAVFFVHEWIYPVCTTLVIFIFLFSNEVRKYGELDATYKDLLKIEGR